MASHLDHTSSAAAASSWAEASRLGPSSSAVTASAPARVAHWDPSSFIATSEASRGNPLQAKIQVVATIASGGLG